MTDPTIPCPAFQSGAVSLFQGDCLDVLPTLPDNSVDLIVTDPPYFRVKKDAWDRQWNTPKLFLEWLDRVFAQFYRVLRPNGSLYVFASPQMAARVECLVAERFDVQNSLVWSKADAPTKVLMYGPDRFRHFVPKSERIIFAEHKGSDNIAKGEVGYEAKCDQLRGFIFEPIRKYLDDERIAAGVSVREVAEAFQKKTGSRTVTGMAGHWFGTVQWALPTPENYQWLRTVLGEGYLARSTKTYARSTKTYARSTKTYGVPLQSLLTCPTLMSGTSRQYHTTQASIRARSRRPCCVTSSQRRRDQEP